MTECLFCKIANKEINSEIIYEDDEIVAFNDISPVAPTHLLFIPKKHIESLDNLNEETSALAGKILLKIADYARKNGLNKDGYRVINNIGNNGGQTVFHMHFHLIGGRVCNWPPG